MKKLFLLFFLVPILVATYGQSPRYGGIVSISGGIKAPDTDTSDTQAGLDFKFMGTYKPISCMVQYDGFEKVLSALIGIGGIGRSGRDQKNTTIQWGIGPQVDQINSEEYLIKNQKFFGAGVVLNAQNSKKYGIGIQTSYTVNNGKASPSKTKEERFNVEIEIVKKLNERFSIGTSGKYQILYNAWYSKPLWTDIMGDRYSSYVRRFQKYTAFIQFEKSPSLAFKVGAQWEKIEKIFPIMGGWHAFDTKPRWGAELGAQYTF